MVYAINACGNADTDCCCTERWGGIAGSRRAQESGIPSSKADHSGDGIDSNRITRSVRGNWQRDHEGWKVEQVPEGI